MASKTVKYGRLLIITMNGTQIDNLVTMGLTQSRDTRETTTKDSADDEESVGTIRRRNISFSGYASEASSANAGFVALQNAYASNSFVTWKITSNTAGEHYWSGSGTLTKLDFDIPHDGNFGFSGEIKPTGVVTFGTD